jgi:hypothetical protein
MNPMLTIKNDGPRIIKTNFWETELNTRGRFFLSANAGAYRLLVPDEHFHMYPDMLQAKEVVITRGMDRLYRKEMLEIMFDDHSQNPLVLAIGLGQADIIWKPKPEGRPFLIYLEGCFMAGNLTSYYRRAKKLPYLKPWSAGDLAIA